jgi:hypothetical protein
MLTSATEKLLAKVIAIGTGFTTIFVVSGSVTDPVNVTKLLSLGVASSIAFGLLISHNLGRTIKSNPAIWAISGLFLLAATYSALSSNSPFSQNLFGSYGRNNGLLAYFFLAAILLASSTLSNHGSIRGVVLAFFVAGIVNLIYCLWVILFGDFIGWSNPYGNILGTLGNPNFIGAFLGMFISAYLGYGLSRTAPKSFKYSMFFVIPITAFEIYDSNAIQGRVVGLSGFAIVGFFLVRSRFSGWVTWAYSLTCALLGALGALGALQIGPLTSLIYKNSVSLRGQYWLAAWNAGQDNPLNGTGMDAFGDWYRRSRDLHALELPGVNTVVNAAHNVPLDMFAFGGWPLFISYLGIMCLGGWALIKITLRSKEYDPTLVVIVAVWVGYQAQSIISINQIGVAIWGWVLTGVAISYERITRISIGEKVELRSQKNSNMDSGTYAKSILSAAIVGIIGLVAALPPLLADSKWRASQVSQDLKSLESTMEKSFFNPGNINKYLINIQILEQSNYPDLARKYALEAVSWNPESYDLWRILFFITASTPEEKNLAIENMKRLDPLNPEVTSTK